MNLWVAPLTDPDAINAVLEDAWIAPKLRRDDGPAGYVDHPLLTYYGAYVDGQLAGVFTKIAYTRWENEVHIAILRTHIRFARELSQLFLSVIFANPNAMRATAHVCGHLTSAVNFVRKIGFHKEGVRRNAYTINGAAHNIVTLGMTREDWSITCCSGISGQIELPFSKR